MSEFQYIVRIKDTDLQGSENIVYELTKIKGISINFAKAVIKAAKLSNVDRVGYMRSVDIQKIEQVLDDPLKYGIPAWLTNRQKDPETGKDSHIIGPDLSLQTEADISVMRETRSWKGIRHGLGLKVRGQRTKTTARSGRVVSVRRRSLMRRG